MVAGGLNFNFTARYGYSSGTITRVTSQTAAPETLQLYDLSNSTHKQLIVSRDGTIQLDSHITASTLYVRSVERHAIRLWGGRSLSSYLPRRDFLHRTRSESDALSHFTKLTHS